MTIPNLFTPGIVTSTRCVPFPSPYTDRDILIDRLSSQGEARNREETHPFSRQM